MSKGLPGAIVDVLERGTFCHIAVETGRGPHLTPTVYVLSGERLWLTTSRESVKGRVWRLDRRVAGLVRAGEAAVSFLGRAQTYDLLDADTWERSVRRAPALMAASVRFTRKNARFFAGYAVDARHVPLAWMPPGRIFAEIEIERAALIEENAVVKTWGRWRRSLVSGERFRATGKGAGALEDLPTGIRKALGRKGLAVLAVHGRSGAVALPAEWTMEGPWLYAALPSASLALAACDEALTPAALSLDRPSWWRAGRMVGGMVQGTAELFVLDRLRSGRSSAAERIASTGIDRAASALLRLRPERVVWWQGWTSATVRPGGRG
ncbi:MAG TPA: pyridoxamine 5'-phosphate oxidase family protein [Actinomycetota bacterium]